MTLERVILELMGVSKISGPKMDLKQSGILYQDYEKGSLHVWKLSRAEFAVAQNCRSIVFQMRPCSKSLYKYGLIWLLLEMLHKWDQLCRSGSKLTLLPLSLT